MQTNNPRSDRRPRVLVVNAYFDPWLSGTPTKLFVPRATAPFHLAGFFDPRRVDVRIHDEVYHGALMAKRTFAWPDLVIVSGLTAMFDRARQLAAYFRHCQPNATLLIGGPMARCFPGLSVRYFDVVCQGDVGDIGEVIDDVLGRGYRADTPSPRFDLAGHSFGLGFVETTEYCNFSCSFCSLTGEGRAYRRHANEWVEQQILAMGRVQAVMVLDNNFYGNNRSQFKERAAILGEHWRRGAYRGWGALVTGDFFKHEENLEIVAQNGCISLFSGVESVDPAVLRRFNKRQSLSSDPRTLAMLCAQHGIAFEYGMIMDFTRQRMSDVDAQIEQLLADPETPLPALMSLTIPIVGTPYFDQAAAERRLMPDLRLSDMDGQKLVEWPLEPVAEVAEFVARMLRMKGRKWALIRHSVQHALRRRHCYRPEHVLVTLLRPMHQYGARLRIGTPRQMLQDWREPRLYYCALNSPARRAYRPMWPMPGRFLNHFEPLMVTDAAGELTETMLKERELRKPNAVRQVALAAGDNAA